MGELALKEGARRLVIWDLNSELLNQTTEDFRA